MALQKAQKQWLGQTQLVPIGSSAGTVLGGTSDAFLKALQDAKRLANLIRSKEPLTSFKRNKIDACMDALFLSFLQKTQRLVRRLLCDYFPIARQQAWFYF